MKGEGVYANVQCLKSSENREGSRSRAVIQIPFTMNLVQTRTKRCHTQPFLINPTKIYVNKITKVT